MTATTFILLCMGAIVIGTISTMLICEIKEVTDYEKSKKRGIRK